MNKKLVSDMLAESDRLFDASRKLREAAHTMMGDAVRNIATGRKRRRRHMSPEAKKRISEQMKKRWAERKKKVG